MQEQRILIFEPFCLDVGNERLWRVQEALHLTHKAFAVLHYLAEHAGQLVTKDALLEVVWSQTSCEVRRRWRCVFARFAGR